MKAILKNLFPGLEDSEYMILRTFLVGLIFGLTGMTGYPLTLAGAGGRLIFMGFLISLASFICGLFTGFLFGMPKRNPRQDSIYSLNNSLVEISDWLTKIIVGLGLVNLARIPGQLMSIGEFVRNTSGITGMAVEVYTICLVLFFGIFGLYHGYNYMRMVLSRKYRIADEYMLSKELAQVKTQMAIQEVQKNTLIDEINQSKRPLEETRTSVIQGVVEKKPTVDEAELKSAVDKMIDMARQKTQKGLLEKNNDPQLGQWGGRSIRNNRQLTATVKDKGIGLFRLHIRVASTDPVNDPIPDGEVILFALHDTFGDPPIRLVKAENGTADLSLISYGSFTVGAALDGGNIELELNLADLPGVSNYFKEH